MADKKISELPLITAISGSIVFVPIVHDGITEKITVENFSNFTNKYAAQTGSANIFTANQTINANLSVNGTSTVSGNASVGGNLVVNGKLTAQELFTEITSASIIFESGSTIFGNSGDDTHQFTGVVSINGVSIGAGAINEFTASQLAVNLRIASTTGSINTTTSSFNSEFIKIGLTTSSIHFTTQSLNTQTGSQDLVNLRISSTTGSINTTTSSFDSEFIKIGSTTSSIHFTTQSLNTQTGSQANLNAQIGIATASLNFSTGALNAFTGSVIGQTNTISTFTSSVNFTTQSLNTQTGSQNSINFNISVVTSSIDAHILKQATQTGSQDLVNYNISVVTSSINAHILKQATQTGSQDLVNYQNSIITSSFRIELNSIEAYTSSLKSAITVNGSNVQIIGELNVNKLNVQYISSSVLLTSGSNIFGDAVTDKHEFTGSVNIKDTLFIDGQAIGLTQLNAFTGSQIGKDLTLSIVTSSIDAHILKQATQTGSQDLVNYNISVYTGSQNVINNSVNSHILAQSTQTGSQDLVNLGISTFTGSLRSEVNLIEAYTASLKGQAIVSSSQQIKDYIAFVSNDATSSMTASYATMAGLAMSVYTPSGTANRILYQAAGGAFSSTTTDSNFQWNAGSSTLSVGSLSILSSGRLQSSIDNTNNISLHDGTLGIIKITNAGTDRITINRNPDTIVLSGSLVVDSNNPASVHQITGSVNVTGSMILSGSLRVNGPLRTNIISGGLDVNGGITGSLMATNGVVSSSAQITNYYKFAETGSANTFYGNQTFSSSLLAVNGDGISINRIGGQPYAFFKRDSSDLGSIYGKTGGGLLLYNVSTAVITVNSDNTTTFADNIIMANGKGIDFSANSNAAGMTSELLNDYEEGTWTPTIVAASGTYTTLTNQRGTYTKIGRQVTVQFYFIVSDKGTGTAGAQITNLPFTVKSTSAGDQYVGSMINTSTSVISSVIAGQNDTIAGIYKYDGTDPITATQGNAGSLTYFV